MLVAIIQFLAFYLLHPIHAAVAVVAGALLHKSLQALWLKLKP